MRRPSLDEIARFNEDEARAAPTPEASDESARVLNTLAEIGAGAGVVITDDEMREGIAYEAAAPAREASTAPGASAGGLRMTTQHDTALDGVASRLAGTIARSAADLALTTLEDRECSCADPDGAYPCWYHLSDADRRAVIADLITRQLGDVILDAVTDAFARERARHDEETAAVWAHLFDVHHCNCELP